MVDANRRNFLAAVLAAAALGVVGGGARTTAEAEDLAIGSPSGDGIADDDGRSGHRGSRRGGHRGHHREGHRGSRRGGHRGQHHDGHRGDGRPTLPGIILEKLPELLE